METIIRIVVGVIAFIFWGYMGIDDSRRGIPDKLTEEEKRYFNIINTYSFVSIWIIWGLALIPLFQ